MIRGLLVAGVLAIGVGGVVAQSDVVKDRQAAMKAMGGAMRGPSDVLKGAAPFDLAKAHESLQTISANAKKSMNLFPAGSTGGDTAALPKVWQTKADFDAKLKKLADDADAAVGKIKDEASFKAVFPTVAKNCGGCHEDYRAKKS